jgi:hypothetical protein
MPSVASIICFGAERAPGLMLQCGRILYTHGREGSSVAGRFCLSVQLETNPMGRFGGPGLLCRSDSAVHLLGAQVVHPERLQSVECIVNFA